MFENIPDEHDIVKLNRYIFVKKLKNFDGNNIWPHRFGNDMINLSRVGRSNKKKNQYLLRVEIQRNCFLEHITVDI